MKSQIEERRFNARILPFEVIRNNVPPSDRDEFDRLAREIENIPTRYGGQGNLGIDGPLDSQDQEIWDRYSQLCKAATTAALEGGYQIQDPASKNLKGRLSLAVLKLTSNSPRDFHKVH